MPPVIQQTVHLATPNRCAILRYSECCQNPQCYSNYMLNRYSAPETCLLLLMLCSSWWHMYRNVSWLILKFSIQSRGVNLFRTIWSNHLIDLSTVHISRGIRMVITCISTVAMNNTNLAFLHELRRLTRESLPSEDCTSLLCRLLAKTSAWKRDKSWDVARDAIVIVEI